MEDFEMKNMDINIDDLLKNNNEKYSEINKLENESSYESKLETQIRFSEFNISNITPNKGFDSN